MTRFNEGGHTTTKVNIDATSSGKMEDKSTTGHKVNKLLVPMPNTISESTNEMKHSTGVDQGYGDIESAEDPSPFGCIGERADK
ncbi:hypothetical protein V6N13_127804 [Hibiscus sabdariffa]|uniref:Uncharacterized protein n=1 Tax=Hibiscus sabdariffa TaxID=183260 RepID=A0ABR2CEK8_9ROSI